MDFDYWVAVWTAYTGSLNPSTTLTGTERLQTIHRQLRLVGLAGVLRRRRSRWKWKAFDVRSKGCYWSPQTPNREEYQVSLLVYTDRASLQRPSRIGRTTTQPRGLGYGTSLATFPGTLLRAMANWGTTDGGRDNRTETVDAFVARPTQFPHDQMQPSMKLQLAWRPRHRTPASTLARSRQLARTCPPAFI